MKKFPKPNSKQMQQDNHNMENKLKQLENQQLPDLSQMDMHWHQMETTLSAAAKLPKKSSLLNSGVKKIFLAASILAAVLLVTWFVKNDNKTKGGLNCPVKANELAQNLSRPEEPLPNPLNDTFINRAAVKLEGVKPVTLPYKTVIQLVDKDSIKSTYGIKIADSTVVVPIHELSLSNFYDSIQKPAQQFIIDAAIGGHFAATEGSSITIPPAAFVDKEGNLIEGKVVILIEEFYKYSDMIAANLTTTSNNEQLITGGMIKLSAVQDNEEVALGAGKTISLSMPTKNYDAEMKLFLPKENNQLNGSPLAEGVLRTTTTSDTKTTTIFSKKRINWQLSSGQFYGNGFARMTKFMDMQNSPSILRGKDEDVAIFKIPKNSPYSVDEAKAILEEKFGNMYRKIKVKKVKQVRRVHLFNFSGPKQYIRKALIGDSVWLTLEDALRQNYIQAKDSAFYAQKIENDTLRFACEFYSGILKRSFLSTARDKINTDSLINTYREQLKKVEKYAFQINKMGWINCDRFYSYPDKIDFVLDLPSDVQADKFVTQLVFTSIRSVMPGNYVQNKIGFLNIPANMPVYVVGLGERDGKVVSFMQPLKTSNRAMTIDTLEETTPELFKKKLKQLDL